MHAAITRARVIFVILAAVAAIVGATLFVLRVRGSEVRHAAWTTVLCGMLAMPVLPALVPQISVPQVSRLSLSRAMPSPPLDTLAVNDVVVRDTRPTAQPSAAFSRNRKWPTCRWSAEMCWIWSECCREFV